MSLYSNLKVIAAGMYRNLIQVNPEKLVQRKVTSRSSFKSISVERSQPFFQGPLEQYLVSKMVPELESERSGS